MSLTPEAVKLLRRVKRHILKEPMRWSFGWYRSNLDPGPDVPSCGTKACVAGWTVQLATGKSPVGSVLYQAAGLLGLDDLTARRLFIHWPTDPQTHNHHMFDHDNPKDAARRIDFFIKTNGTDILPEKKPRRKNANTTKQRT